ncbi:MAG: ATP-binding protein [bacterium]|nr:ATP-binding protein [bacterium]
MRIQTGNPVRGDDFFVRENLIEQTWEHLKSGSHILIAAPRRVGKTSLMRYLEDFPRSPFSLIYLITESVNSENEFYRRILNRIVKTAFVKKSQKILTFLEQRKPAIKKIGVDGIEFGAKEEHDYFEMLVKILQSPHPEANKLVIMVDEFPETLENIIEDHGEAVGKHFLQSNRELRQDTNISENVQFIYTGSIGLENIVSRLNAVSTINDLVRLKVPPLTEREANQLIHRLLTTVQFTLAKGVNDYIFQQIEWLIPFYIQLTMQELRNISRDRGIDAFENTHIDKALQGMLEQRNHFEHWHARLRSTFKGREYSFVKDVLNITSEKSEITSNEIFDLAVKYDIENSFKDIIGSLAYDGYINNHDDVHRYRFNSPILKMWWRQNVAN